MTINNGYNNYTPENLIYVINGDRYTVSTVIHLASHPTTVLSPDYRLLEEPDITVTKRKRT